MNEIKEKIKKALPQIAMRVENELIIACPVDKGLLRLSIKVMATETGILIHMNETGKWVEFGTPPHIIRAKNKQSLKFEPGRKSRLGTGGKAKFVFAKEVKHPGTRPNPFIRNTLQMKLQQIIVEEIQKV